MKNKQGKKERWKTNREKKKDEKIAGKKGNHGTKENEIRQQDKKGKKDKRKEKKQEIIIGIINLKNKITIYK